ncbi:hypothetical protein GSI_05724 [Ganoderma sinense ZZ0214-1]|uniref:DUF6535 domain-containing protein n=1 Tax=Ganoderma sinense ZZ0214-1 TaxID=1077348 RepID=A0A2G8SB96_9APHY|nr:hypothetical protein GSI_05724 [Ganoderma sinense ZZ0214-1]
MQVDEEDSYDQWAYIADALGQYYKDRQKVIYEELDGLLSFSGIFTAVVTLFAVQSVVWLQPDNTQFSADILRRISQQISNQTTPAFTDTQPSDSEFDTRVTGELTVCFMLSLIISVSVSIMSLWAKKSLRKYLLDHPSSSYDRSLLQLYRNRDHVLQRWLLHDIATILSTLLLISIVLFCYGMSSLAAKLKSTPISRILGVINILNLIVAFGSVLVPLFIPSWPLRPLLPPFRVSLHRVRHPRRRSDLQSVPLRTRFSMLCSALAGIKFRAVEARKLEEMRRHQVALELEALAFANRAFWGSRRLRAINELFRQVDDRAAALDCIVRILRVDSASSSESHSEDAESEPCTLHPPTVFPRDGTDKGLIDHLRKIGGQILGELEESQSGTVTEYGYGEQDGRLSKYRRVFASASNGLG